ncbi:MAG: DNA-directed RNA polymerase subunit omega [Erysipelotrichales bacterium]|nr:DNA-directed RNA polymerase subunit omega [Erysipelotrichales bacterium]
MNSKNKEGLRYPSIDDLLEKVDSKYKLAYIASKRAKLMDEEEANRSSIQTRCVKSVGKALEEVLADLITVEFKKTS